jgi:hypothetical protein
MFALIVIARLRKFVIDGAVILNDNADVRIAFQHALTNSSMMTADHLSLLSA